MRRRGPAPKQYFVSAPSQLTETTAELLPRVYNFSPLRSRMKQGPTPKVIYPARRQTYVGAGKFYSKQTVDDGAAAVRHELLLDDGDMETIALKYELGRKFSSQFEWKTDRVGGVANFPFETRFETGKRYKEKKSADRIYDTDTGPKLGMAKKANRSLQGLSIARDTSKRSKKLLHSTSELIGPGKYDGYIASTKLGNNWAVPSNFFASKHRAKTGKTDKSLLALQYRNRKRGLLIPGKKKHKQKSPWAKLNKGCKIPKAARQTFSDRLAKRLKAENDLREDALYRLKAGGDVGHGEFVRSSN